MRASTGSQRAQAWPSVIVGIYTCSYAQQPCSLAWLLLWQEEASCSSGKQSARTFAAFPPSIGKLPLIDPVDSS